MDAVFVVLLILAGINAVCFTFFGNREKINTYIALKCAACGMLLPLAVYALFGIGAPPLLATSFLLATIFCVSGDVLLAFRYRCKKELFTMLGMSSFSLGQLGLYITLVAASSFSALNILIAAVITAVFFYCSIKLFNNKYDKLIYNAAGYMFLIVLALVQSFGVLAVSYVGILAVLAAAFFLASDCLLSMMYFGGRDNSKMLDYMVHIFYFAAQFTYVSFIYFYLV